MPTPLDQRILDRIAREFSASDRARIAEQIATYSGPEAGRVAWDILDLSKGSPEQVTVFVAAALTDYRDVLYWAEYFSSDPLLRGRDPKKLVDDLLAKSGQRKSANRAFLTAEWRHLAMVNFQIDATLLKRFVPHGTELDFFRGNTYVSVVGFRFLDTRVFGVRIPFHQNFEEVNLRFYVRRKSDEGWRRGVVFIRELVPRRAIAFVARRFYGEPYTALPMRHRIGRVGAQVRAEYEWRRGKTWEALRVVAEGEPKKVASGSEEEFITEHYWGYTARPTGCSEYQVEHPQWETWQGIEAQLDADVSALYGEGFRESLTARPSSAFIANGSPVTVRLKSDYALSETV